MSAPSPRRGERILVLRYRFLGDTLLTVPFLRNLRRAKPDARIVWVVAPGSSDVIQGIPYVDELLPVHNLESLKQLATAFAQPHAIRGTARPSRFERVRRAA